MRRVVLLFSLFGTAVFSQTTAPLTLSQAIGEAVEHNLDLLAAKYDISVAETRMITAKLRPNPVATVVADHLDVLGTHYGPANNAGPNEFAYRTDFVFERGGKRASRIAVAERDKELAKLNVTNAVRTLVLDVQSAFLDVQLAKENLSLAEQNQKALQNIVNVNQDRVRVGDLAQVELSRSQVAALQFQTAVQQARIRLQEARNRLQLLLGRVDPVSDLEINGEFRRETLPGTLDTLLTGAMERRPDLAALRTAQARTQADLRLQLAQGKIDYTIGTEYRRQQGYSGTGNSLGVFFSAPIPVFNRNQGEIQRAQRESDQALARIRALQANVRSDVTTAWQKYQTSQALLGTIENSMLEQARSVRATTEYSYRRGEATLVEFLDAQRAFNDAMQTWNEARAEYARSLYQLEALTNTGAAEEMSR